MPNIALFPSHSNAVAIWMNVIDGLPSADHELATSTGGAPLESGAYITDHAYVQPERLRLKGWISTDGTPNKVYNAWQAIRNAQRELEPIAVVTPLNFYPEMLVVGARAPHDAPGLEVTIELEEIQRAQVIELSLPPVPAPEFDFSVFMVSGEVQAAFDLAREYKTTARPRPLTADNVTSMTDLIFDSFRSSGVDVPNPDIRLGGFYTPDATNLELTLDAYQEVLPGVPGLRDFNGIFHYSPGPTDGNSTALNRFSRVINRVEEKAMEAIDTRTNQLRYETPTARVERESLEAEQVVAAESENRGWLGNLFSFFDRQYEEDRDPFVGATGGYRNQVLG